MFTALTVDYELYFGENAGSVGRCIVEPTDVLLDFARRAGCRLVLFVDAGMLFRMEQQRQCNYAVSTQYDAVRRQLARAAAEGHDIQLHLHPHWEDSYWDGTRWLMNTRRYRFDAFAAHDVSGIMSRYRAALLNASGYTAICAIRAGGMLVQPFEILAPAMRSNGLFIDSSVVPLTHQEDPEFGYDFRAAPSLGTWRFASDPAVSDDDGEFVEFPVAAINTPVMTKLSSAISKRLGPKRHATYGDGLAVGATSPTRSLRRFRRLFGKRPMPVTFDGYQAVLIEKAYRERTEAGVETFVILGHPKALTPFAVQCLERFAAACSPTTVTFPELGELFKSDERRSEAIASDP